MSPKITSMALALAMFALPVASFAQIGVSITIAPPELPVYEQPVIPGDGYLWTPGYWGYGDDGYFWVPGTWVQPPSVGLLWTPGYWGWANGNYAFNRGYWGPHIGFYGGVNYGYGYGGDGYSGGRWNNGSFAYNREVNNVNISSIHNTYSERVTNVTVNRVSFNGGAGISARPNAEQETFAHEHHVEPTSEQSEHEKTARADPAQRDSVNHGHPAVTATARPGEFKAGAEAKAEPGNKPAMENKTEARDAKAPAPQAHEATAEHAAKPEAHAGVAAREQTPRSPAPAAAHAQTQPRPQQQAQPKPRPQPAAHPQQQHAQPQRPQQQPHSQEPAHREQPAAQHDEGHDKEHH